MESAPKDGTWILAYDIRGTAFGAIAWIWNRWSLGAGTYMPKPTHWMPLPDPPAALALTAGETE
jgi:uncharacterized protein DUF551